MNTARPVDLAERRAQRALLLVRGALSFERLTGGVPSDTWRTGRGGAVPLPRRWQVACQIPEEGERALVRRVAAAFLVSPVTSFDTILNRWAEAPWEPKR